MFDLVLPPFTLRSKLPIGSYPDSFHNLPIHAEFMAIQDFEVKLRLLNLVGVVNCPMLPNMTARFPGRRIFKMLNTTFIKRPSRLPNVCTCLGTLGFTDRAP